jgi:hypothetical protein
MRKPKRAVLISVAALMLALTGLAAASVPTPTRIAATAAGNAPRVFVDSRGTVNVVWSGVTSGNFSAVRYARKPPGAKHFTTVALPSAFDDAEPFIYEPSPGVLRIIAENGHTSGVDAFSSTNDGVSWTTMDTTALNAGEFQTYNTYPNASQLVDAPGGPIEIAGDSANDVVQLNSSLTGVTTIATTTLDPFEIARTGAGATFILGQATTSGFAFQVGSVTGQLSFPSCSTSDSGAPELVAGRSVAVVGDVSCGHLRTRTITASGVVGPLVTVGASPGGLGAEFLGSHGVGLVADRSGNFTAAYLARGGDARVARSSGGSHWTTARGLGPVPNSADGSYVAISSGAATWLASATATNNTTYAVLAMALSDTYRTPRAPSAKGITDPHRGSLGSLAVTVPGELALKSFRKSGKVTLRLVSALPDRISESITVSRTVGNTTEEVCGGGATTRLAAGRVRTVTYTCGSGAIVIGGPVSSELDVKTGDLVTFSFDGRNGPWTLTSRVG